MKAEQNELITRVGPGTGCGELLRRYWQPAALVDEFNPALDPRMTLPPVKAVRLLGQDLVLFKDAQATGACWTATARTAAPTCRSAGMRATACAAPFMAGSSRGRHLPGNTGRARRQQAVRARAPAQLPGARTRGVVFAWMGPGMTPPPFPAFDCFTAPATHSFAFKGLWNANWLQASRWASIRRTRRSCTASCRTRRSTRLARTRRASSFAAPAPARSTASAGP
jgi:phthalate 4,5-dioxygenase oxygenase subunit